MKYQSLFLWSSPNAKPHLSTKGLGSPFSLSLIHGISLFYGCVRCSPGVKPPTDKVNKTLSKGPRCMCAPPSGPRRHISVMAPYWSRDLLVHTQCPSIGQSLRAASHPAAVALAAFLLHILERVHAGASHRREDLCHGVSVNDVCVSDLRGNCPVAPWNEGLALIKP